MLEAQPGLSGLFQPTTATMIHYMIPFPHNVVAASEPFTFITHALVKKLIKRLTTLNKERKADLLKIAEVFEDPQVLARFYVEPDCTARRRNSHQRAAESKPHRTVKQGSRIIAYFCFLNECQFSGWEVRSNQDSIFITTKQKQGAPIGAGVKP